MIEKYHELADGSQVWPEPRDLLTAMEDARLYTHTLAEEVSGHEEYV